MTTTAMHPGLEEFLPVNPFRQLIHGLIDDICDTDFEMLISLSKNKLGDEYEAVKTDINHQRFFDELEKRYGEENTTTYLINLMECTNLCSDTERFAERIRRYRKEKEEYNRQCMEQGVCKDPNFIGREKILSDALQCFGLESKYKGVILCGLGGMGKTTLASEICYSLKYKNPGITFRTVDLREKASWKDVLLGLLTCLGASTLNIHNEQELEAILFENVKSSFKQRSIVFLDNADKIVMDAHQFNRFESGLIQLFEIMDQLGTDCKTKVLMTTRQKFCKGEEMLMYKEERMNGRMKEFELSELQPQECVMLLHKCSGKDEKLLPDSDCEAISTLCGGSPMALRIIAGMLRDQYGIDEILTMLSGQSTTAEKLKIESVLKGTFMCLDKHLQELLVKLSLFQTAKFDFRAALAVGMDETDAGEIQSFVKKWKKSPQEARKVHLEWHLLQLKQRHMIEFVEFPEERGREDDNSRFSLHPLVWNYVKEVSKEAELQLKVEEAKKRFLVYFTKIIDDYGKTSETEPLTVTKHVQENTVHLKQFYEFFVDDVFSVNDFVTDESSPRAMTQNERIRAIAEVVLDADVQKSFFRQQAERLKKSNNLYRYMYWRCQEADNLVSQDRHELAELVLNNLQKEICFHSSSDSHEEEVIGRKEEVDLEEIIPPLAAYHRSMGGCFDKKNMFSRSLEHLSVAECLLSGRAITGLLQPINEDGSKNFRKSLHRRELADVVNKIGTVYFRQKDFKKAETYHDKAYNIVLRIKSKPFHIDMPTYVTNLGSIHHQIGVDSRDEFERKTELEKARKMYDESIRFNEMMNRNMSMTHVNTLRNRANVLYYLGKEEEALKNAEDSLAVRRKIVHPPNTELTQAMIQVATIYLKVGKRKKEQNLFENANRHFNQARMYFEEAQKQVLKGGLPMEHNSFKDYTNLRADHMQLLQKILKAPSEEIEKTRMLYRDFEDGKYTQAIKKNKHRDTRGSSSSSEESNERSSSSSGSSSISSPSESSSSDEMQEEDSKVQSPSASSKETDPTADKLGKPGKKRPTSEEDKIAEDSPTSMIVKLMKIHPRSFDEDTYIQMTDITSDESTATRRKKPRKY